MSALRIPLTFLVMIFVFGVSHAQETEPAPFPPEDTTLIFGENVEVLDFHLDSTFFREINFVTISLDYLAVIINDGRVYPFPERLTLAIGYDDWVAATPKYTIDHVYFQIGEPYRGGEEQYVSADSSGEMFRRNDARVEQQITSPENEQYWMLDLTTGVYTRLREIPEYVDTLCGAMRLADIERKDWFIIVGSNRQRHACNITTGLMTPPLPDGYEWQVADVRPTQRLFLIGLSSDPENDAATLVTFDFASGDVSTVGDFTRGERNSLFEVPDFEDTFIFSIGDTSTTSTRYWIDLNLPEMREIPSNNAYYSDPPRFEAWEEIETSEGIARQITILNLLTNEESSFTFEPACIPGVAHNQGTTYYCRVINNDATQADVVRTDVISGQQDVIYTGEVEEIRGILYDGRCMLLLVDSNGVVDSVDPTAFRATASGDAQMVLIDVNDGSILYEVEAYTGGFGDMWMPNAAGINEDWIGLYGYMTITYLLHIEGDAVSMRTIEATLSGEFEEGWLLSYPLPSREVYSAFQQIKFYHLETGQETDFVNLNEDLYYYAGVDYLGDGIFEITVGYQIVPWLNSISPFIYDLAVYRVRVPEIIAQ